MGDKGTPYGRFRRAIDHRSLPNAEAAARELGRLDLADALELLLLIAVKDPPRFERAAVRWHARFCLETRGLEVRDSMLVLAALAGVADVAPRVSLETLALVAERFHSDSVARAVKRRG